MTSSSLHDGKDGLQPASKRLERITMALSAIFIIKNKRLVGFKSLITTHKDVHVNEVIGNHLG